LGGGLLVWGLRGAGLGGKIRAWGQGLDGGMSWEEEMANELAGIRTDGGESAAVGEGSGDGEVVEGSIDDDDFEKELGL
jgi:hypothetical protein